MSYRINFLLVIADIIVFIENMKTACNHQSLLLAGGDKGLTLVGLLIVIGVLGIIALITIPNMSHAANSAGKAYAQRNAQSLVGVSNSAAAAGVNFIDPNGDVARTVENIAVGGVAPAGILKGTQFGLSTLTKEARRAVIPFLKIEGGALVYVEDGIK